MTWRDGVTSKSEPEGSGMCSKEGHSGNQKSRNKWREGHIYDGLSCSGAEVRGVSQEALLMWAPSSRVLCQPKGSLVALLPETRNTVLIAEPVLHEGLLMTRVQLHNKTRG